MTIEQAVNAIESHLKGYMDEVPEKLLKKIHDIILRAKKKSFSKTIKTKNPTCKRNGSRYVKNTVLILQKLKKEGS
jgi:hypothetical protein